MIDQITARIRLALEGQGAVISDLERVKRKFSATAKSMAALAGGLSIAAFTGKLLSVQREFDALNSSLITVTGSSQAAAREMEWIRRFAKETPFGLAQATQAFVKMKALGLDPSQAALTSYGNTAAAMGKDLNQMIEAVADAATGEFTRLKEFGIKASKQGDQIAFTFQGVTTKVKNSAREIEQYLQQIGNDKFGDAMAARAKTLDGAIAALGDSWDNLFLRISQSGIGAAIAGAVETADKALSWLADNIDDLGAALATGAIAVGAVMLIKNFSLVASTLLQASKAAALLLIGLGPIGWAVGAVTALTAAYVAFKDELEGTGEHALRMGNMLSAAFELIRGESSDTAATMAQAADGSANAQAKAAESTVGYWEKALRGIATVMDAIGNVVVGVASGTRNAFEAAGNLIHNAFARSFNAIAEMAEKTLSMVAEKYNALPFLPGKIQVARFSRMEVRQQIGIGEAFSQSLRDGVGTYWMDGVDRYIQTVKAKNATDDLSRAAKGAASALQASGQAGAKAGGRTAKAMKEAKDAAMDLFQRLTAKSAGVTASYQEDLAKLQALHASGRISADEYRQAVIALIEEQPYAQEAAREIAEAERELLKARQDQERAIDRQIESAGDLLENLEWETRLLNMNAREREVATRLRELERLGIERGTAAWQEYAAAIENVITRKTALQEQEAKQKALEDEWQKTADQINQSLTDALMRGFESGKGFARNLRDTLKNLFGTLVLRPIIQPVAAGMGGLLASLLGGSAMASTGGMAGAGSGGFGLNNLSAMLRGWTGMGGTLGGLGQMFQSGLTLLTHHGWGALGANLSALWSNGAYSSALAQGAGALSGALGGFMGGRAIGQAISGGYAAWGSGRGATNIGSAIGLIGGPIGALIGGAIGGLVNRMFGRKLTDFGIEGEFGGDTGFDGRQYEFYRGGWFRSDKRRYSELDAQQRHALALPFLQARTLVSDYGSALGLDTSSLANYRHSLNLSTKGKTPEEIAQAITAAIAEATEGMARTLLDQAGDGLSRDGETAVQTLERMAASLATVNNAFGLLGRTLLETSVRGADLASLIVEQFGEGEAGRSAFNQAASSYLQNFYTEAERRANALTVLGREFDRLGLNLPATRAQFRALVDGLDLTTQEGRHLFAQLMSLSGAFADATDSMEDAAESARAALEKLQEALDAAASATDAALSALEAVIDRQLSSLQTTLDAAKSLANEAKALRDTAWASAHDLYGAGQATSALLAAQGRRVIAESLHSARAGLLPDAEQLKTAIGHARGGLDAANYASHIDYERDRLVLAGQLQEIGDRAHGQLTVAEQQVQHLQTQIDQLNQQKEFWREQIALMRGQGAAVASIGEGVAKLVEAMEAEKRAREAIEAAKKQNIAADKQNSGMAVFGGGSVASFAPLVRDVGKFDEATGIITYANGNTLNTRTGTRTYSDGSSEIVDPWNVQRALESARAGSYIPSDFEHLFGRNPPKFADGGYHAGGWAIVGEEGPELVNFSQPSRIYSHADTRAALGAGGSDAAAREVAALRRDLNHLREVLLSIADSSRRASNVMRNSAPDGDCLQVRIVTP